MNTSKEKNTSSYTRFFLMLGFSFIAMYITMYLNTYEIDHVYFSLTRFYMTCLGIAAMAVIMLSLMLHMYKSKKKNLAIYAGSALLFISALYSTAILTSKRAEISDPEVKKLAEDIIKAQEKEIKEMKAMIKRLEATK